MPRQAGGDDGLGQEWQALTKLARKTYDPICHLCKRPIDLTLDPKDKWSWTLDHLDPRAEFGNHCPPLERTRPAHRTCNSRKQALTTPPPVHWKI